MSNDFADAANCGAMPAPLGGLGDVLLEGNKLARAIATGLPSFVRRAQAVERAEKKLRAEIAAVWRQRTSFLFGDAHRLEACRRASAVLPAGVLETLDRLREHGGFKPRDVPPVAEPTKQVAKFQKKIERFNDRWRTYLGTVSLEPVHAARRGARGPFSCGRTIREVLEATDVLPRERIDALLDVMRMVRRKP